MRAAWRGRRPSHTPGTTSTRGGSPRVQALIQLTDLGLAWKTVDDQSLVFVYSCLNGQPLTGVRLETFAEDASALGSFTTDACSATRLA